MDWFDLLLSRGLSIAFSLVPREMQIKTSVIWSFTNHQNGLKNTKQNKEMWLKMWRNRKPPSLKTGM